MTASKQTLRAHVLDPSLMDLSVRPQDDFYRYINGTWLAEHSIPADRASDGAFYALQDLSEERCHEIAKEAADGKLDTPEAKRIGILYRQFMDVDTLNRLGVSAIKPLLDSVASAATHDDLAALLGTLGRQNVSGFFSVGVMTDMNDTSQYCVAFDQGGLGLPDESYYSGEDYEEYRQKYVEHVAKVLSLGGVVSEAESKEAAAQVMEFETRLAAHHWDVVKSREVDLQNNPRTWEQLVEENPGFNWSSWREGMGLNLDGKQLSSDQPSFLKEAASLWKNTHLEVLKLWLSRALIDGFGPYLSDPFAEETFDFYGRVLSGIEQMRPRWKRALSLVDNVVGFDLGRLYVQRHFPAEYKERMQTLVQHLLEAYRASMTELDWMSEGTKKKALQKLDTFDPKIGYPDNPRSYAELQVSDSKTLVQNLAASAEFDLDWEFSKLDGPVDRSEWHMTPHTVNAYYYPTMNEIVFPAAILQPPLFDPEADDAVNYGAIGAIIGHEIGHGFDDQGSQFDAQGVVENWWTDEDRTEFEKRTRALIKQYDAFSPAALEDKYKVNGAFTIGENIGDLGGLTIGWKAWVKALADRGVSSADEDEVIDGLTGPERFFASWARIWRGKAREAFAIQMLAVDPHSPAEFRCNGVLANLDQFAEHYHVEPGDELWIDPADRVRIW